MLLPKMYQNIRNLVSKDAKYVLPRNICYHLLYQKHFILNLVGFKRFNWHWSSPLGSYPRAAPSTPTAPSQTARHGHGICLRGGRWMATWSQLGQFGYQLVMEKLETWPPRRWVFPIVRYYIIVYNCVFFFMDFLALICGSKKLVMFFFSNLHDLYVISWLDLKGLWCAGPCARRCPGRRFPDFGTGTALGFNDWFNMVFGGCWCFVGWFLVVWSNFFDCPSCYIANHMLLGPSFFYFPSYCWWFWLTQLIGLSLNFEDVFRCQAINSYNHGTLRTFVLLGRIWGIHTGTVSFKRYQCGTVLSGAFCYSCFSGVVFLAYQPKQSFV